MSRKRMTNKSLVDYCNSTPTSHCEEGCPYESRECEYFIEKYKSIPCLCDKVHPEFYTDEVISEGGEERMTLDELIDELVKIRDSGGGDTEVYFRIDASTRKFVRKVVYQPDTEIDLGTITIE